MTDIVERLRDHARAWGHGITKEAADEIERLRSLILAYDKAEWLADESSSALSASADASNALFEEALRIRMKGE